MSATGIRPEDRADKSIVGLVVTCLFQAWKLSSCATPVAYQVYLVGGLEHFLFSHILGIIIPTD